MSNTPLPQPTPIKTMLGGTVLAYGSKNMIDHAAAVTAAKDAEIAGLRESAEIDADTLMSCGYALLDRDKLIATLQERIKVLEDALRAICSEQDARQGYASVETYDAARTALEITPPPSPSPRS